MKITKNKRIYAATGSIDEMLNQFNKRIDELSASDITSSTDTDDYAYFLDEVDNQIYEAKDNYGRDIPESQLAEIVKEHIEMLMEREPDFAEEVPSNWDELIDKKIFGSEITSSTDTDNDKDYIAALKNKISDKFKSKISSCDYSYDDENYYFTVTSGTDVYEYTVPKDDLIGDEEKDAEYICSSIEEDINEDKKTSQTVKSSQYSDDEEYDPEDYEGGYTEWKKLKSKPVKDPDGNVTDYNMWYNEFEDIYVFTLGDPNVYYPENSDTDWECEDYDEAIEWFNGYNG